MSVDAQRLQDLTPYLHAIWYSVMQITFAVFFLWRELGSSCIAGICVIFLSIPLTKKVAKMMGKVQKKLMKKKDARLKVNNEILTGMKVIKLQAWEQPFKRKIQELRSVELELLREYAIIQSFSGTLWNAVPLLVAVATFTTYTLTGHDLDVATALTSLALFEILRFPLFMFPRVINNLVEANISINRLSSYLLSEEWQPIEKGSLSNNGVNIDNSSFVYEAKRFQEDDDGEGGDGDNKGAGRQFTPADWELKLLKSQLVDAESHISRLEHKLSPTPSPSSEPEFPSSMSMSMSTLRRINFTVEPNDFIAVVGGVGCGKSTLLNSILGEMRVLSNGTGVSVRGRVAYAAQTPFIFNDTLQNNISFGRTSLDRERYDEALSACALLPDLETIPNGDQCEIGEKGINLSGGQKARISLARAVYHAADLYLLDDVLSAVDAHVGRHLFEQCIVNTLLDTPKKSSVVLVTNALQFLSHPRVTKIVVLDDGGVKEMGTYRELVAQNGAFKNLLHSIYDSSAVSTKNGAAEESEEGELIELSIDDDSPPKLQNGGTTPTNINSDDSSIPSQPPSPKKSPKKSLDLESEEKPKLKLEKQQALMTDEMKEREVGSVGLKVYKAWAVAAGGITVGIAIILCYLGVESLNVSARWWLSYWSEHGAKHSQGYFLSIYASINIAICIAVFTRQLFVFFRSIQASRVMFTQLLDSILRAPMSFFDTTPVGRIVNRFSKDIYTLDEQIPQTIRSYLSTIFAVIGTVVVISVITPWFMIALVPIIIFYKIQERYFTKTYRELKRLDSVSRSPVYSLFGETLDGVTTIRAFKASGRLQNKMLRLLNTQQKAYFLTFSAQCWLAVRLEMVGTFIIFLAAFCAVLEHSKYGGDETFAGAAGLSISFALSVTQSLNWSVRMSSDLEANMVAVERIEQFKHIVPEAPLKLDGDTGLGGGGSWPMKGEIIFQDVCMRYRDGLPLVLKGLNLNIKGGSSIGVVGRTGAGKSSLMVALTRLVEVASGRIMIDGVDTRSVGLNTLRSRVAVIAQDPVLFSGTIKSNLDPFDQYSDDVLKNVLMRCGLGIDNADGGGEGSGRIKGLDDEVLEEGQNFSVGQRQLLVIARALLTNASILIMDEASASLDNDSDAKIQVVLKEQFRYATKIVIAHRINTIMDSDYILVMDDGKCAEFDPPADLLKNTQSLYRKLVDAHEKQQQQER